MSKATSSLIPAEVTTDREAFVERLSAAFSTVLREDLDTETMEKVVALNDGEAADGPCHSHDFCDANMSMLEAIKRVAPNWDFDPANADAAAIWNEAWADAKHSGFAVDDRPALAI